MRPFNSMSFQVIHRCSWHIHRNCTYGRHFDMIDEFDGGNEVNSKHTYNFMCACASYCVISLNLKGNYEMCTVYKWQQSGTFLLYILCQFNKHLFTIDSFFTLKFSQFPQVNFKSLWCNHCLNIDRNSISKCLGICAISIQLETFPFSFCLSAESACILVIAQWTLCAWKIMNLKHFNLTFTFHGIQILLLLLMKSVRLKTMACFNSLSTTFDIWM